ncbi:MAG: hypothetical protein C0610_04525, partial [Desulfobacteraceae bacterium]
RPPAITKQPIKATRIFCIDAITTDLLYFIKDGVVKNIRILSGKSTNYGICGFWKAYKEGLVGREERICGGSPVRERKHIGGCTAKVGGIMCQGVNLVSCPLNQRTTEQVPLDPHYISGM